MRTTGLLTLLVLRSDCIPDMLFNSLLFLLVFLPVTFLLFEVAKPSQRLGFLLVASVIFYGYAGIKPLLFLLLSVIWVHVLTAYAGRMDRRLHVFLIVAFPLSTLFLFRYLDFAFTNIGASPDTREAFSYFLDVLVPAGISFYTFQIMCYGIDVVFGRIERERSLAQLATYVSFFPQLIAGPIVRYQQVSEQYRRIREDRVFERDFAGAFRHLAVGLTYKVFLADGTAYVYGLYSAAQVKSSLDAGISIFAYSMQIYYDFWGYSLIAIGLGKLFGIELPRNFDTPYLSPNPAIFWRRWHITLSYWLRDYVYIPLGGREHYLRNILIIFSLVGLWHGADWRFVLWGLYHAILVLGYHYTRGVWDRMPVVVQTALCFVLVSLGWPLFNSPVPVYFGTLIHLFLGGQWWLEVYALPEVAFLGLVMAWTFFPVNRFPRLEGVRQRLAAAPGVHAFLLVGALLFFNVSKTFIYFRF